MLPQRSNKQLLRQQPWLACVADALYETAANGWPANPPLSHAGSETVPDAPPVSRRPDVVVNATAVCLSNNKLTSLQCLPDFLLHVLEDPSKLRWIDLSCNSLQRIPEELLQLSALSVRSPGLSTCAFPLFHRFLCRFSHASIVICIMSLTQTIAHSPRSLSWQCGNCMLAYAQFELFLITSAISMTKQWLILCRTLFPCSV